MEGAFTAPLFVCPIFYNQYSEIINHDYMEDLEMDIILMFIVALIEAFVLELIVTTVFDIKTKKTDLEELNDEYEEITNFIDSNSFSDLPLDEQEEWLLMREDLKSNIKTVKYSMW